MEGTMRDKLVTKIMETSGEEFETLDSVIALAKESEEKLLGRVLSILDYYMEAAAGSNDPDTPKVAD